MKFISKSCSKAFTLIEAIFMVCILVVLVAILLPRLTRTRGHARRISCSDNLQQISLAFKQWALDNNDKFPMQVSVTNGGTMELIEQGNVYANFLVMSNELNTPNVLICPEESDRNRRMAHTWGETGLTGNVGQILIPFVNNTNTSYFVGVDAEDTKPGMLFVGDACFSVAKKPVAPGLHKLWPGTEVSWTKPIRANHGKGGHIGLTDGSVTACDAKIFQRALRQSGDSTNRVTVP